MADKKVLIINFYAGSPSYGMVFRHYYLAREWAKAGIDTTILASSFSHLRKVNVEIEHDLQETEVEGVKFSWIKENSYVGNGLGRFKAMMDFSWKIRRMAGKIAEKYKPDVIIASCTNPIDTYAAQKIAKLSGAKLIHEVRDLWPLTLELMYGFSKLHPLCVAMQAAENSFLKHSDYVVSVLPNSKDYMVSHGMAPEKFRFIPNGITEEEWVDTPEVPESIAGVFRDLKEQGKFIIGFMGSHTDSYSLSYLIDAVQKMGDPGVCVVFVGGGREKARFIEMSKRSMADNFIFLDPVEKRYIPAISSRMDALYVAGKKNEIVKYGVAMNKMFDSMMSGRPILYGIDAPNNYISEYNCGISCEPENSDALMEGIRKLREMTEAEREKMGENGRQAVLEHFTYRTIAEQFRELF
ncbi:MAG: glycosyltransferase family 4 protein [Firmicutes bacterium]|nr:glycosyltransferase family 4 protein [Bacillota bacterium]